MIVTGFLLSAAIGASSVTAQADAANLAYTQCLFASSRAAHEAGLPVSAFERQLTNSCRTEQRMLERAVGKALAPRGQQNSAAEAHALAEDARRQVVDDYRRMMELEPQLRAVAEMCRAHPEQCRQ